MARMTCSQAAVHGFYSNTATAVRRLGAVKVSLRPNGRISPDQFRAKMSREGFAVRSRADDLPAWKRTEVDYYSFTVAVCKATA